MSRPISAAPAYPAPSPSYGRSNGLAQPTPTRPATAPIAGPSLSMPIPARRPWGLIVLVLLIDLGLAVAGSWMLNEGLGTRSTPDPPPPESK